MASCHHFDIAMAAQESQVEATKVAGKWQMTMDTPHGAVQGDMQLEQDGAALSGTYTVEHMGSMKVTGKADGKKVSMKVEVPGANVTFGFTGMVDGDKMSGTTEMGGSWKAARQ